MTNLKDIPGFNGEYQATIDGQIWSVKSKKMLSQSLQGPEGKKYYYVGLCFQGRKMTCRVNRLIALTFVPNPDQLPCVNHKDNNPLNNSADNLEWCSYEYNNHYNDRIIKSINTRKKNGNCTKTLMCDKNTHEILQEFESTSDAIAFLGLTSSASSNISAVINGRKKSAYGYFWRRA